MTTYKKIMNRLTGYGGEFLPDARGHGRQLSGGQSWAGAISGVSVAETSLPFIRHFIAGAAVSVSSPRLWLRETERLAII